LRLWRPSPWLRASRAPRRRPGRTSLCLELLEGRLVPSILPYLLKDVNTDTPDSGSRQLTAVSGLLFFEANDAIHGYELWKSNGTAAGTAIVKDINPGSASSSPLDLTNVNGTLFFTANDGTNHTELWRSDGTAAGTLIVKDFGTGSNYSTIGELTNVNGTLFL